jgi:hypothetical protein
MVDPVIGRPIHPGDASMSYRPFGRSFRLAHPAPIISYLSNLADFVMMGLRSAYGLTGQSAPMTLHDRKRPILPHSIFFFFFFEFRKTKLESID